MHGLPIQNEGFYSFESFIQPPTIFRYDTRPENREVFATPKVPFDSSQYEVTQVFYTSKDGTRVPMFIAGKKGLQRNGSAAAADDRLWRLRLTHAAALEPRVRLVDAPRRLLRAAQPARRR